MFDAEIGTGKWEYQRTKKAIDTANHGIKMDRIDFINLSILFDFKQENGEQPIKANVVSPAAT